jgi:hypothetical protein
MCGSLGFAMISSQLSKSETFFTERNDVYTFWFLDILICVEKAISSYLRTVDAVQITPHMLPRRRRRTETSLFPDSHSLENKQVD